MTVQTSPRTEIQANYLNLLHQAADNMRRATKALAAQATQAANFSSTSQGRPDIYAQNSAQALETVAVLNALIDQGGLMQVDPQDFKDALDPGRVHFSATEEN